MFRDNSLLCISIWRIRSAHTVEEEHSQHIHVSCLFKSQLPLIRKKYIYLYHKIYCLDSSSALMEETLVHKMRTTMWEACDRVVYVTGTVLWPFKTPISIPVEFITTPGITSCWLPLHSLKWEQIYGQIWLMHGWGGRGGSEISLCQSGDESKCDPVLRGPCFEKCQRLICIIILDLNRGRGQMGKPALPK